MHELSIAMELINIAESAAREANADRVEKVYLKVGALSGVVRESLEFAYEVAANGTLLEHSQLIIEELPLILYCATCEQQVQPDSMQLFCCPICGTPSGDIRQGRELEIDSMEVVENEPETVTN